MSLPNWKLLDPSLVLGHLLSVKLKRQLLKDFLSLVFHLYAKCDIEKVNMNRFYFINIGLFGY